MNILDLIRARRTIHSFKTDPVPKSVILQAIEAAILAPNHRHTWPWRFFVVEGDARLRIADLAARLKAEGSKSGDAKASPASEIQLKATRDKFLEAGAMLLVGTKRHADPSVAKEDYASLACGLQNMALYLWDQGYGSKWATGKPTMHQETYKIANINPDEVELHGVFWIGKFSQAPAMPPRPPVESFIRW